MKGLTSKAHDQSLMILVIFAILAFLSSPVSFISHHSGNALVNKFKVLPLLLLLTLYATFAMGSDKRHCKNFEDQLGYLKELTLGNYAANNEKRIVKWVDDINIFIEGDMPASLHRELDLLVFEINQILSGIELSIETIEDEANYYIFVNSAQKYLEYYPETSVGSLKTGGVFNTYGNLDYEITHGSIYIDLETAQSSIGKFTLRKLLSHSLGIHHQSQRYESSVFAENRRSINGYSDLDKVIIELLYSKRMKAGMDKFEVDYALLNEC